MSNDPDYLRAYYGQLETDELLRLRQSGTLTEEAQIVLGEELVRRIDDVPPPVMEISFEPSEADVEDYRRKTKLFRNYFIWSPIIFLPSLQVRGILWVGLAMIAGRYLAHPLVRWIYVSNSNSRDRNFLLTLLAICYPVLLWGYVKLIRG
jgi:hypothetical protein